ncbi:hypothetical protein JRO89_XS07G0285600 [Xanthoceras sorbifolium]|uniref:ADP-ribosyl cyclase/cyclic ADP-ribose hydrolase n=1 Tax=Xanthoceras sorbifolium TaxID=99658 RepID=A0ABQ8HVU9_9ROSI|nr:hypothetical protein JRO89_XS07G0285600 [Xanthoceras sorbifolium]
MENSEAQFIKDIVDEVSRKLIQEWKYDIFLSFRAADTGNTFTDHLYSALDKKGFKIFRDVQELERSSGKEMLEPIEQSRLSIIILSKNYASSTRCLDETVKISECMEEKNQTVFPIFYDVGPWEVRQQRGNFEDAFDKHYHQYDCSKEKVLRWRHALRKVASLSGYYLRDRLAAISSTPERFVFSSQPLLEEKTKNDAGNKTHGKQQRRCCEEPSMVMADGDGSGCSRGCGVWSGCGGGGCNKGNIGRGSSGSFKEKLLGLVNPSSWMYSDHVQ